MSRVEGSEDFDLDSLPLGFLDAYPYPAFVLHVPVPYATGNSLEAERLADLPFQRQYANSGVSGPADKDGRSTWGSFLNPIWSNTHWKHLLRRKSVTADSYAEPWYRKDLLIEDRHGQLLPLLDLDAARRFGNWVSGVTEWRRRQARGRELEERRRRGLSSTSAAGSKKRKDEGGTLRVPRKAPRPLHNRVGSSSGVERPLSLSGVHSTWHGNESAMDLDEDHERDSDLARSSHWRQAASVATTEGTSGGDWDDGDELGSGDAAASQPHNLHLEKLGMRLLLSKTPYPMQPDRQGFSYLVVLATPCPDFYRSSDFATPSSELARFSLSGPDTPSAIEPSLDATPSTARGLNPPSSEAASYFPPTEPLVLGQVDTNQLACYPRRPVTDPLSVEYLIESTDWSKTPLGPRDRWPQSLKTSFSTVLAMPCQATLWWGPQLCMLYNDHYAAMIANKHPQLFGQQGAIGWSEAWAALGPLSDVVMAGTALTKEDDSFLFKTRDGGREEEYFHSWSWVPVRGEGGKISGLLNWTRDTSSKVIAERRLKCTRNVGDGIAGARNIQEYSRAVEEGLADEGIVKDIPYAIMYHCAREEQEGTTKTNLLADDASSASPSTKKRLRTRLSLAFTVGVPDGHRSTPNEVVVETTRPSRSMGRLDPTTTSSPTLSLISALSSPDEDQTADAPSAWPLKDALQSRRSIFVQDVSSILDDSWPIRSWDVLPESAVVLPICNDSSTDVPAAVLIVGLNVKRKYDHEYQEWLQQLRLQLYGGLLQVQSLEQEFQRAKELAALDEMKSNWLAGVSHELKLPLALIAGPVDDLAKEAPSGSRAKQLLNLSKRNVARLQRLIDELMAFSSLEAGKLRGYFRPVPYTAFVADIAGLFRPAIERSRLRYSINCDPQDTHEVFLDPAMIEKVILNLIGNSLKYTHKGHIAVSLRYSQTHAILVVSDSGVGIPRDSLAKVTERFYRVPTTGRTHEGTGIGLSLVKELVRLHAGTLDVESETADESPDGSHGSTFTVQLPLGRDHLPPSAIEHVEVASDQLTRSKYALGLVDEASQWDNDHESSAGSSSDPSLPSEKSSSPLDPSTLFFEKDDVILIADDSKDMRAYLSMLLTPYARVIQAADGQEAFELARRQRPSIIISDINMPRWDGFALLQAVKADPDVKFTPIVLLTARAGEDERVEGLLTGAEDYMTKPFNSRELIARVSLQVQLGKRRRILEEAFASRLDEVERRREEAEMERRRQELLIDVTSHELRNPTSAILQSAQLVGSNLIALRERLMKVRDIPGANAVVGQDLVDSLEEDRDLCESIVACAQHQTRIADDVLALARISMETLKLSFAPTDVVAKAKEIAKMFALDAKAKDIELVCDTSHPSLRAVPIVSTDPTRLGQVVLNLVINALRWTAGAQVRRVSFSLALSSEMPTGDNCLMPSTPLPPINEGDPLYLYVAVTDTGPGLSKEDLSLLFKRFSQATKSNSKVFGGSGLGLFVCRSLCHAMGGRIEVDSAFGEGCCFRFYIRVTAAQLARQSIDVSPAKAEIARRPARVLVVEDNPINLKVLLRQLQKAGVSCDAASDGLQGLNKIKAASDVHSPTSQPYDVVLMDLEMPVMSGLEAIAEVRRLEGEGTIRRSVVFALTGNARQQQVEAALAAGMDRVLVKPYKIDEVLKVIREQAAANDAEKVEADQVMS